MVLTKLRVGEGLEGADSKDSGPWPAYSSGIPASRTSVISSVYFKDPLLWH